MDNYVPQMEEAKRQATQAGLSGSAIVDVHPSAGFVRIKVMGLSPLLRLPKFFAVIWSQTRGICGDFPPTRTLFGRESRVFIPLPERKRYPLKVKMNPPEMLPEFMRNYGNVLATTLGMMNLETKYMCRMLNSQVTIFALCIPGPGQSLAPAQAGGQLGLPDEYDQVTSCPCAGRGTGLAVTR